MAKPLRWLAWTLAIAVILIAAAVAVPFFVPLSTFIPQITEQASKALGQPVVIGDLQLRLLPTPRAVARAVRVGKRDEAKVEELQIVPDLVSYLAGAGAIRLISAEKVELKEAALRIADRMPKGGAPVDVRRVVLLDVRLQHATLRVPFFDLDLELANGQEISKARLSTRDGALKVLLDPAQAPGRAKIRLEAAKWRLPLAAAPLVFDSLKAEGALAGKRLELPKIDGRLYSGSFKANARVDWRRLWQVSGTLELAGVDVGALQRALGRPAQLTGRVSASSKFAASARTPEQLASVLSADGPFNVADGVYQGVDLSKVGDLTGSKGAGGRTRFDELRGKLQLRGRRVRIDELCARSTALVAGGFVEIAPEQTLSGRLGVSVAKTAGFVGVPVTLSGTAQEPVVRPTRGYTIGAVLGTVLLPGVGTALGGSAGGAIEGGVGDCK